LGRLESRERVEEVKSGEEAKDAEGVKELRIGLKGDGSGTKIEVLWNDLNDAEFAETWSENVEHGVWRHHKHTLDVDVVPVAEGVEDGLSIEAGKGSKLVL
jgi:hypothetical protein